MRPSEPPQIKWLLIAFVVTALLIVPVALWGNSALVQFVFSLNFFILVALLYYSTTGKRKYNEQQAKRTTSPDAPAE